MIESLAGAELRPFVISLGLLLLILALEVVSSLLGGSLLGGDVDMDVDLDVDADFDVDADPDLDTSGLLSWLGLGAVPFLVWLACVFAGFGMSGLVVQYLAEAIADAPAPMWIAVPVALVAALLFAREVGTLVLRYLPKAESSAVSRNRLGGRHGVVTGGTAREGSPAQARVRDAYGNIQYIRVVPLPGEAEIAEGTDILVMRGKGGVFTAAPLKD
ncbi:OB-fold-containig protein [Roseobacter sp. HKCCA0434]|uniref:OB-fold-containig protein n=1 Tax=Roseobacter sp. HKCCA0434 TaxID=3079297 RepID=UPI0029057F33|nr:OB-fold-containig protein [Roseobacter sp. HKCCA0434]